MPRATRKPETGSSAKRRSTRKRRAVPLGSSSESSDVRSFLERELQVMKTLPSVETGIPGRVPNPLKDQLVAINGILERLDVTLAAMPTKDIISVKLHGGNVELHGGDLERFRAFLRQGMPGEHAYVVLLGLSTFDVRDLLRTVAKGFSYSVFDRLLRNVGASFDQLTEMTDIPRRTLTRRKQEGRLTPDESDRVLRASRLFGKTLELFEGDRKAALDWLARQQTALGGAIPLELAKTELGAREVEKLIDRLEYGVFS
jgi:putative toxin-antitoxin system antitoxin component (TIGR02293 family)